MKNWKAFSNEKKIKRIYFVDRWLKPMLWIGMKRSIEEDDIYAVTNDMRSDLNTDKFSKLWDEEVKREKPSIFRVLFKLHLFKLLPIGILYAIGETIARYQSFLYF